MKELIMTFLLTGRVIFMLLFLGILFLGYFGGFEFIEGERRLKRAYHAEGNLDLMEKVWELEDEEGADLGR